MAGLAVKTLRPVGEGRAVEYGTVSVYLYRFVSSICEL